MMTLPSSFSTDLPRRHRFCMRRDGSEVSSLEYTMVGRDFEGETDNKITVFVRFYLSTDRVEDLLSLQQQIGSPPYRGSSWLWIWYLSMWKHLIDNLHYNYFRWSWRWTTKVLMTNTVFVVTENRRLSIVYCKGHLIVEVKRLQPRISEKLT